MSVQSSKIAKIVKNPENFRLGRVCCALRSQADVEPELICGEHDHDVLVFHQPAQIGKALDTYRHGVCMQGVHHGYDRHDVVQ